MGTNEDIEMVCIATDVWVTTCGMVFFCLMTKQAHKCY